MNDYLRTKIKVLSFFLVVLVVIVHAYNINMQTEPEGLYSISGVNGFIQEMICQGLNRIASPLFFIISGYLFFVNINGNADDFRRKLKKRFKTLIIPYIAWSVWGLIFYFVLQYLLPAQIPFSHGHITDWDLKTFLNTLFLDPIPYQLWYVRDLTVFALLSPLIYLLLKYGKHWVLLFFVFTWFYDFYFYAFRNQSILFFYLGAYLSRQEGDPIDRRSPVAAWVFSILWVAVTLFKTTLVYNGYQDLTILTIIHKVSIATGVLAVNFLYNALFSNPAEIMKHRLFRIVTFSFFLFASHEPVSTVIKKGFFWVLGSGELTSFLVFLATPVLTISICLFAGYHLKRLLPQFYGTITGWR